MLLIEFCGTPAAGKDSTINRLRANYDSKIIKAHRYEQAHIDPIEIKILFSIAETYLLINNFLLSKKQKDQTLTIFNRGLLDRIAWARLLRYKSLHFKELSHHIEEMIWGTGFLRQLNACFFLITPYQKILERRQKKYMSPNTKRFEIVNPVTIAQLNNVYLELYEELKNELPIVLISDLTHNLTLNQKYEIVDNHINRMLNKSIQ